MSGTSAGERTKMKSVEMVVSERITTTDITCVKNVVVLKGYVDDGKTTVLKEVVRQLHEMYPDAWALRRRYDARKFDITMVVANEDGGDCVAVYKINGIVILIFTGGDNPSVVTNTFAMAAKYRAQVVVSALKVKNEGCMKTRAQLAYELIERRASFETTYVDICGRRLRSAPEEQIVAREIVGVINNLVKKEG